MVHDIANTNMGVSFIVDATPASREWPPSP